MRREERVKLVKLSDSEARKAISQDIKTNLFVEASAGSGKTTSLVNRMVALVEAGVPVNEICTITFTVAAADEFFERFQRLLSKRTVDDLENKELGPTTEISKARCLEALNNIDSCFSGTMDSFCNMVAHELPNELDIPSDAKVISEEEKNNMIVEEYYSILTNEDHPLYEEAMRFNFVFKDSYNAFIEGMNQLFDYREYKVAYDTDLLESDTDHILDNEINDFIRLINLIKKDGLDYIGSASSKDKAKALINKVNRLSTNYKANIQDFRYALSKFNSDTKFSLEVEGTDLEVDYLVLSGRSYVFSDEIKEEINRIKEVVMEFSFQVYFSFLSQVSDEITLHMKRESKFTFFDFLYYLTKKFQEDSSSNTKEIVSHVYERHSHILIDESQDTNPMQTQLFFYLTGLVSSDNWELVEPRPGSLFIVGDPKQSIYSFRGADVKAYNHVKDVFSHIGEVITLSKNFRSNVALKEYFNKVMNKVLDVGDDPLTHPDIPLIPETEKGKQRVALEASKDITLNGVYLYHTSRKKSEDAKNVVELVKRIVNNDNYKIISKHRDEIRKIDYKDILIITRGKKVPEFIKEFAENKIPLRVEAKIYFSNSPAVDILKKLLYLSFEPYEKKHFIDVVTSDLYKLNTSDILQMRLDGFDLDISNIEDIHLSNSHHLEIIEELHFLYENTRNLSVSSTLFYLLSNKDFEFFRNISSDFLDYAYYMVELVKSAEKDNTITSFNDAKYFLENSISDDSDIEKIMKFSNEVNQVKISNLHKVKGLQAPIVILASPHVMTFEENKYVDQEHKVVYFSNISIDTGSGNKVSICESNRYQEEMKMAKLESEAEERRVEYVAATRAESVLIIGKPDKVNGGYRNPWEHLLTDDLEEIPNYDYQESNLHIESYDEVMKEHHSIININSNYQSFYVQNPSALRLKTRINNIDEVEEDLSFDFDKALLGTLIHKLLECLVNSKNTYDMESLVKSIIFEYVLYNKEYHKSLFELLVDVGNKFVSIGFTQSSKEVPENLFSVLMKAEEVYVEVPFSYKTNNNIVSGIIDLIYKDDKGYHIIDYKTNSEGDTATLEEEYKAQLSIYRKAFKQSTGYDADTHIYHIDV